MPIDLVVAAYGDDTPCIFQWGNQCNKRAKFLVTIDHSDGAPTCVKPEKMPVCQEHKAFLARGLEGFWADVMGTPPCGVCGKYLRLGLVESINAAQS
jgi:hypothetical protein